MNPLGGRINPIVWLCLGTLGVAYVVARSSPGAALFAAAQFIFLLPVFAAALLTLEAYRIAPQGDERRVWGLLSAGAWLLAGSESYFSWYQLAVNRAGPASPSVNDWLNLAAACAFLTVLVIASGLSRFPTMVRMRVYTDAVAVMALSLMVLFRFWSGDFMGQLMWLEAVRWALYTFFGVAMLASILWLGFGLRYAAYDQRRRLIGVSVGILAVGTILAPFIDQPGAGSESTGGTVVLTSTVFMIGYGLMAIAALARIRDRRGEWQSVMSRPPGAESELVTGIMSLCMLLAVCLSAVWALNASSAPESTVYFLMGLAATFAMVARTAIITLESSALQDSAARDPLTGVGNERSFEEHLETGVLLSHRAREPFVLAILNLDDFTRINEVLGRPRGDQVLFRVGEALEAVVGRRGEVFRLSGDEFAVIVPGFGADDRTTVGSKVLASVSAIDIGQGLRLSASVGVVSCDEEACASRELARKADAAQVWAKYHGKGRVVVHDERIVRALGVDERLRLDHSRLHYDVARALAASADARDSRSVYHSRNVAALAVLLGEAAGLKDEQLRALEIAAMLHDVGQIALPDELVVGPFTPARRLAAREHAVLGEQLVGSVGVDGASTAVRSHHERWDGGGYPDGLAGEEIAIESRIIALADAYDGMTSGRRSGTMMSRAAALQEIDHALGTRFDPLLAEKFIRLVGTTSSLGWSDEWVVQE